MFYANRVAGIGRGDRVLEVGPGGRPHPRSDVLLEYDFGDPDEARRQRGYTNPLKTDKTVIYYNDSRFPFVDNEFDYVRILRSESGRRAT